MFHHLLHGEPDTFRKWVEGVAVETISRKVIATASGTIDEISAIITGVTYAASVVFAMIKTGVDVHHMRLRIRNTESAHWHNFAL